MYTVASTCANVLAGASQLLPIVIVEGSNNYFDKATADKICTFAMNNLGANFGVLTYKALTLVDRSPLHHNYFAVVSLVVAAAGTLYTRDRIGAKEKVHLTDKQDNLLFAVLTTQSIANGALGAFGLFRGDYTYGAVALVCSAIPLATYLRA